MQLHLDSGDDIAVITCDAALTYCEANQEREFSNCAHCVGRAREGLRRLSRPVRVIKLSELVIQAAPKLKGLRKLPREYRSFDELYQLRVDNFDIGAAVLSTINSVLEDPEPNPSAHRELTWVTLSASFAAYAALDRYLGEKPCDLFYLLNGRLANFRAALRACQKHGVHCIVHERGCDHYSYSVAEDTMPHDPAHVEKYFAATLAKAESPAQKRRVAEEFYNERRQGKIANWVSYTEDQIRGAVPDVWLQSPTRIAVFSSTESEFACLRDYYPALIYPSQIKGLELILRDLARNNFSGMFVVRMHPNCENTKSDFTKQLRALPYPFLRVIAPEEKLDSYALLQSAQKVLVWESTIGIEAAYWGIPSIVAGWAAYRGLGSTYSPISHAEVMDLLLRPLEPKPIDGAIDYGFYSKNFGTRFKYVTPLGPFSAKFKGSEIHPTYPYKELVPEVADRSKRWRRFFFNAWNRQRLNVIYRGHRFSPDPIRWLATQEGKGLADKNDA